MLITAIFNAMTIPLAIAFQPMWTEHNPYTSIDMTTNFIFFADILIVFNTAYFDKDGEEVRNRFKIFKRYALGMFLIDFLSSIPFNVLAPGTKQIRILNMLKIIRILRIAKIINKLRIPEESKAVSLFFFYILI